MVLFILLIILWQHFLGFPLKKFDILYSVYRGIIPGILNCLGHNFHTAHLASFFRQKQRNRSNPAVQIPDYRTFSKAFPAFQLFFRFLLISFLPIRSIFSAGFFIPHCKAVPFPTIRSIFSANSRILHRKTVKFLRLHRIHLIKRQRRDLVLYISDIICDILLPPDKFYFVPQNHIRPVFIYIQGNACHPLYPCQPLCQGAAVGEPVRIHYQAYHDLFRPKPIANQHMADGSFMCCLIVRLYVIFLHKVEDYVQDSLIYFHPQRAAYVGDDAVGAPGVKSRNRVSLFILADRELGFVPIVKRSAKTSALFHSHDRIHYTVQEFLWHAADAREVPPYLFFFKCKLFFIGHLLYLAAAAFPRHGADRSHTIRGGAKNLRKPCIAVVFLRFHELCLYDVADYGIFYKYRVTVCLADALSIYPYICNLYLKNIIFLHILIFQYKPQPFRCVHCSLI